MYLQDNKCHEYPIYRLKNEKNVIINKRIFYYFFKTSGIPRYFSMKNKWQQVYENFRILWCSNRQLTPNIKRRRISFTNDVTSINFDDDESTRNIIIPAISRRKITIIEIIGDYNNGSEGRILFKCEKRVSLWLPFLPNQHFQFNIK